MKHDIVQVRYHKDYEQFEREVDGLLEVCKLVASCRDSVARDVLAFMPAFDKSVINEAKRRIGII